MVRDALTERPGFTNMADSTNCLVRGGACGYPVSGSASGSASGAEGAGAGPASASLLHQRLQQLRDPSPASPEPSEAMPLAMPYRSMELFHHCMLLRTSVSMSSTESVRRSHSISDV